VIWTVRVRSAGRQRAVAYARDHRFEVGAPVEFDHAAERVSALEYVLGAFAADLVNTFTTLARVRRLEVDAVEAVVSGALDNPLTVLRVVGEAGHPGIERIRLKLYVASAEPHAAIERVWREAQELSPLTRTFQAALTLELEIVVTP